MSDRTSLVRTRSYSAARPTYDLAMATATLRLILYARISDGMVQFCLAMGIFFNPICTFNCICIVSGTADMNSSRPVECVIVEISHGISPFRVLGLVLVGLGRAPPLSSIGDADVLVNEVESAAWRRKVREEKKIDKKSKRIEEQTREEKRK